MKKLENPMQFKIKKNIDNIEIRYTDLMEITQGGPEVGNISINGKILNGRYGGPAIYKDNYVYVPAYVKKIFGMAFKLARINTISLAVELLGKNKNLIFLDKIENNRIYFFEDINGSSKSYIDL